LFIRRNIYIPIFATLMRRDETASPLGSSTTAFTIAFILCGLWHDLSIHFLMWGGLHAFGLVVTNAYMHLLRTRMEPGALRAYQKSRAIRVIATVVTYEFVAFSMLALFFPKAG
jgi:D-alanyl-lipoteichoic acid acyltransferase DltB (MBOAT superfamily)